MVEALSSGPDRFHRAAKKSISEDGSKTLTAKQRAWVLRLRMLIRDMDDAAVRRLKAYKHAPDREDFLSE